MAERHIPIIENDGTENKKIVLIQIQVLHDRELSNTNIYSPAVVLVISYVGQGLYSSTFTSRKKSSTTLAEKGLDHEFISVDVPAGDHKKEPVISINPFGQVPAFEDGDLKLFESRAITRYIAEAYADKGISLLSADPRRNAIISVWTEVESLKFDVVAQKIGFELSFKPLVGYPTDEALVKKLMPELASVLAVADIKM